MLGVRMRKGRRYAYGSHSRYRLQYHLVWIPKYRKRVLCGEIATAVQKLFYECGQMNDWWIEQLNVMPDHIHMLVELPPTVSVPMAVKTFKGGSSRALRLTHPELEEWLWGGSFWSVGYFAESVGRVTENVIRQYIENQRDKPSMPQQKSLGL
jgi:putative transposase